MSLGRKNVKIIMQSQHSEADDAEAMMTSSPTVAVETVTLAEVTLQAEALVRQVQEVLGVDADTALSLLFSHHWNVDQCLSEVSEGAEGVFQQVCDICCRIV